MTRSQFGVAAIAMASFVLWLVLGGTPNAASLVAGIAVAAAVGVWASIADM